MIENSNPEDFLPKAVIMEQNVDLNASNSNRKSIVLIYPNNDEEFVIEPRNELIDMENLSDMRNSFNH